MLSRWYHKAKEMITTLRRSRIYHVFLAQPYQLHTIARLDHLDSLGLALRGKRVLEVGAATGEHTLFYLHRGCQVVPTDARPELVEFLRERFGLPTYQLDVETQLDQMVQLGTFDIVHCYGLLYHISKPLEFLQAAAKVATMLILETCVSPGKDRTLTYVEECRRNLWEAVHGKGCLPTRPWVFATLREHYAYVYCPVTQPRHPEFPRDWDHLVYPPTGLIRAVFIASHVPLHNPMLVEELPTQYREW